MREFSEKELQEEYKNLKMTEIPDMWEDIERKLAPKKKKVIPVRRIASVAAIFAAVLLLVPVLQTMWQGGSKDMAMELNGSAGAMQDAMAEKQEISSESANSVENADSDVAAAKDAQQEAATEALPQELAESEEAGVEDEQQMSSAEKESEDERLLVLELKVQILYTERVDGSIWITGEVLETGNSGYQAGDEIQIEGDGEVYETADFSGVMELQVEKAGENLNLLEILP